jgi:hypothetical protein
MSGTTTLSGQPALPLLNLFSMYIFLAENWQSLSAGQEKQLVAVPARGGFRERLKWVRDPDELTVEGKCGGSSDFGEGEQRNHRMRSMSWQDLVMREGALVDSFRQLPL